MGKFTFCSVIILVMAGNHLKGLQFIDSSPTGWGHILSVTGFISLLPFSTRAPAVACSSTHIDSTKIHLTLVHAKEIFDLEDFKVLVGLGNDEVRH